VISDRYFFIKDEWRFVGPEGAVSVKTNPCIQTNNGDTCRAAALVHQGIIFQPTFLAGKDLADGKLVALMPSYRATALGIYAVHPTRKHLSAKVRVLIDFLAARFAGRGPSW
jgi:DNA-binding transcriptional LysR family regulator